MNDFQSFSSAVPTGQSDIPTSTNAMPNLDFQNFSSAVPTGQSDVLMSTNAVLNSDFQSFSSAVPTSRSAAPTSADAITNSDFQGFSSAVPPSHSTVPTSAGVMPNSDFQDFSSFKESDSAVDEFGDFSAFSPLPANSQPPAASTSAKSNALPSLDGKRINIMYKGSNSELSPGPFPRMDRAPTPKQPSSKMQGQGLKTGKPMQQSRGM